MKKLSIYLFSIEYLGHTNGVDRHIKVLMNGLGHQKKFEVFHFAFISDPHLFSLREYRVNETCLKVYIPLPNNPNQIFNDSNILLSYNIEVCDVLRKYLVNRKNIILHVHTLNIMPLVLLIKKQYPCKSISHIHCLSWKYNIEWNPGKFVQLFNMGLRKYEDKQRLLSVTGEWEAYNQADAVVCVTECGRDFVKNMQEDTVPQIYMIHNGLYDSFDESRVMRNFTDNGTVYLLFAGGCSKTKGLYYLFEAIHLFPNTLKKRVCIMLVGSCTLEQQRAIKKRYKDVNINFIGMIGYNELEKVYYQTDIGAILSLHEQCSYTAIEMMMHQIPIVATNIDGLSEMFEDKKNAMLVPIVYKDKEDCVAPDIYILSQKLELLIKDNEIRKKIGKNGRSTFLKYYRGKEMMKKIIKLYRSIIDYDT